MCEYFLGAVFCRLFLHWSIHVRILFYQLLLTKMHTFLVH